MSNHFHLLIKADLEELASFMAKVLAAFANYYNYKHNRIGYVFQSRYKSQVVENIGYFCHNAQSVRVLKDLEKLNISIQTLDGILSHNGEILINKYRFNNKKEREDVEEDILKTFYEKAYSKKIVPMTLEASAVRLSDIIAYIGRDIEDSIKIGVVKREDLPKNVIKVLGDNNSKIVDTLIKDIITNSFEKPYLTFSEEVFDALMELKDWNYKNIYASEEANKHQGIIEKLFHKLYCYYLERVEQFENNEQETIIFFDMDGSK